MLKHDFEGLQATRRPRGGCALAVVLLGAMPALVAAAEFQAVPGAVTATGGASVVLRVTVAHPAGRSAIRQVAAEVSGAGAHAAFPSLYDDGTHGDAVSGDGEFTLAASLPAGEGERAVVYYAVDQSGVEVVTEPATFTLE